MYNKAIRPYVKELVSFLGALLSIFILIWVTKDIVLQYSIILVLFFIMLAIWLGQYLIGFVSFACKAILDYIQKDYCLKEVTFITQVVFRSNSYPFRFFMKRQNKEERLLRSYENMYLKLFIQAKDEVLSFIASEYHQLEPGREYVFVFGRRSKALFAINPYS